MSRGLSIAEFPILCQTCLGENPYMRMMVDRHGQACKVCNKPFTTYRWCPGPRMRYKKTEICQLCSKAKNVCQTCLLDLKYSLPVQVRDKLLQVEDDTPKSDLNREYHMQILHKQVESQKPQLSITGPSSLAIASSSGTSKSPSFLALQKLARKTPYHKRNLPHICSFWVKGECRRGDECPYRHEIPTDPDDPLSKQNIKDRYHGTRDPVAQRLLAKAAEEAKKEKEKVIPSEFTE